MTSKSQTNNSKPDIEKKQDQENEQILCPHCLRTATNGLKCKGICVSDNNY